MKTLSAMTMALLLAAPLMLFAPAAQAEATMQSLFDRAQSAFGALPKGRIKALVSEPGRGAGDVQYTRAWLDAQPKATGGEQWQCLSEALYFEARGETVKGQFAVAEVIMNRVEEARFPDTPCDVINQGTGRKYQCQFTYTCDGREEVIAEKTAFERVAKVARAVLDERSEELTKGATHYHTTSVRPSWAKVYTKTVKIGVHQFYRHTVRTASN